MPGSNSSPPAANAPPPDEPLGLTVHSLPVPQEAAAFDSRRTASGRLRMLAVLLVCAAPVIASYLTYYVIRPSAQRNYGELIERQPSLPAVTANQLDGAPVQLPSLKGQWLLVSVGSGACDALCERQLYLQRQLREGLGKEKGRVDWVWLLSDDAPVRDALKPALGQATVLRVKAGELAQWLAPAAGQQLPDHLYLVDPVGRWMMRFPATTATGPVDTAAAAKMKRDIERVLRASSSWDVAGRPATP